MAVFAFLRLFWLPDKTDMYPCTRPRTHTPRAQVHCADNALASQRSLTAGAAMPNFVEAAEEYFAPVRACDGLVVDV